MFTTAIGNFCQVAGTTVQFIQNSISNINPKIQDGVYSAIHQSQRAIIPTYFSVVSNPLVYTVTLLSLIYLSEANVPLNAKAKDVYDCAMTCLLNNCIPGGSFHLIGKNYEEYTPNIPPELINWSAPCPAQCRDGCLYTPQ